MSRTILAEVDGFTPVIDEVVKATSLMSAVVFGRIWRFCQMPDGVCNACLEKIAEDIGIDKATVMRHAKILVDAGYLEDLSPDLRNHPHTYKDTGKASLHMAVSSVAHSNAGVAENNASVAENQLKKVFKKEIKIEDTATDSSKESTQNVFKVYQNNIAMLTSATADALEDDEKTYGPDWVCSAIQEAALSEVHSLKYVEAILKRWKRDGYKSTKTKQEAQAWTGRTLN